MELSSKSISSFQFLYDYGYDAIILFSMYDNYYIGLVENNEIIETWRLFDFSDWDELWRIANMVHKKYFKP